MKSFNNGHFLFSRLLHWAVVGGYGSFNSPPVLQKPGSFHLKNTYKTSFWYMSESTCPYTLMLLSLGQSFSAKNKGFLVF